MKQIHIAKHAPEAHLIRGFLQSHGIEAVVRGEYLTSGWGELPLDVCRVWIVNDADLQRAQELVCAFLSGAYARVYSGESWTCPNCLERLEGQFTECWHCGARRPASAP
jgi:putative signal transducing protein